MANTDNKCKDLEVRDYWKEKGYQELGNSLEDLYSLQAKTQNMYFEKQGRKPFSEFTIGDVVDFLMVTNHAIIDELHEMMDAVGGIEDGFGNAACKQAHNFRNLNACMAERRSRHIYWSATPPRNFA